ncbi:HET-domain-containing protein, partial [Glonium stellatum]
SIRLLRLMPLENESTEGAEIQCELLEYSLQDPNKGTHLYEALSYTWGSSEKPRSVSIKGQNLAVTENLYTALLRLRDRSFERIIWIDAVCINQENLKEQGHQVQLMAEIYSKAIRVLVWLGETADNSDTAMERIRIAAENESTDSLNNKIIQQAIFALLQRPWFRRIWVLQEVAAARHILIICGSIEIDGYAFCLGVNRFYEARPDLESLIRSIIYLIRGAIFRPKHVMSSLGRASLNIRPLGELIDMFHTHEATKPVDKVYALLGMSSDNPNTANLLPDYEVIWEKLFENLIKFLLCNQVFVKTRGNEGRAVIKSRGCVLGQVLSIKSDDRDNVNITFRNMPKLLGCKKEFHALWTLQASAKHIREGDIVCLLQGALKPMIIRPCKDYFIIIRIAASPEGKSTKSGDIEWAKLLRLIKVFPRDFLLIWDWENSPEKLQDLGEYETLIRTTNWVSEHSKTELGDHLDKATRTWNVAMVLDDLEEYQKAEGRLQEAMEGYKVAFGVEHPHPPKSQYGRTPLSHEAVIKLLLKTGKVEIDFKNESGRTPLSLVAGGGYEAVVKLLLETSNVEINSKDESGQTPLSWAARRGHHAVVKLLLGTGNVEIDSKDKNGRTPLIWAITRGHKAVVKLLLGTG